MLTATEKFYEVERLRELIAVAREMKLFDLVRELDAQMRRLMM